ncbi:SPOR domain-containing protein [Parasalinivibrio latis]|uniref:SPOR domain-containing protein n=1 Tax=Parasalinivibrio latis TaxID=2952610 RepID=UPI0030E28270
MLFGVMLPFSPSCTLITYYGCDRLREFLIWRLFIRLVIPLPLFLPFSKSVPLCVLIDIRTGGRMVNSDLNNGQKMKNFAPFLLLGLLTGCAGSTTTTIVSDSAEMSSAMMEQPSDMASNEMVSTPAEKPAPEVAAKPAPKPAPVKPAKPAASHTLYTIQVLALSHDRGFADYVNALPSNQPVWSNKKVVDGIPWYTLLYGEYSSYDQAKSALKALPGTIREYGPFIRKMNEIKSSGTPLKRLN